MGGERYGVRRGDAVQVRMSGSSMSAFESTVKVYDQKQTICSVPLTAASQDNKSRL